MIIGRSIRDAARRLRRRPGLLLVATGVAAVQAVVVALGRALGLVTSTAVRGPSLWTLPYDPTLASYLAPVVTAAVLVLTLPLQVGIYVPAREPPAPLGATLRRGAAAVRERYRPVLGAVVRAEGLAVLAGLGGALGWYVLATVLRAGRYVLWTPGTPYPMESLLLTGAAFLIALGVARVALGFADLAVLSDRVDAVDAWRVSLSFAGRNRGVVAGYAVVVAAVGVAAATTAGALAAVLEGLVGSPVAGVGAALLSVAVAAVATAFVGCLHVAVFDSHGGGRAGLAAPTGSDSAASRAMVGPGARGWGRVVVAALLLLAAVGGAAAVRVDETWTHDRKPASLAASAAADETYRAALERTAAASHRIVLRSYNRTEGDDAADFLWDVRVDQPDRQAVVRFHAVPDGPVPGDAGGGYYDSGVLAVYVGSRGNWTNETGDRWRAIPAPGWAFVAGTGEQGRAVFHLPRADLDWSVVSRNESTLVLRVTGEAAVRASLGDTTLAGMGENMTDGSRLTVYVDRERLVIERAVWHVANADPEDRFTHVVRVTGVGSYDVERPAALPPRGPLEWLWDALYY